MESRKALGLYRNKAKTGELAEDKDTVQHYWDADCKSLLRSGRQNGRIHAKTKKKRKGHTEGNCSMAKLATLCRN